MSGFGRLYGVGLGPGDPELLTLKAARVIGAVPVIAYFAKLGRRGHARTIVDSFLKPEHHLLPMYYPVTTEVHFEDADYVSQLSQFYAEQAALIAAQLEAGRDVAVLSEGDPLFYGSFMHLYERLRERFGVTVIPGVTGMAGCWSAAGLSMTWGDDILSVLPGTLDAAALAQRLKSTDAAVIMKLGKNFAKVRAAVVEAGLLTDAYYVERGAMAGEKVTPLKDKTDGVAPYFSMILIPGQGRRP